MASDATSEAAGLPITGVRDAHDGTRSSLPDLVRTDVSHREAGETANH